MSMSYEEAPAIPKGSLSPEIAERLGTAIIPLVLFDNRLGNNEAENAKPAEECISIYCTEDNELANPHREVVQKLDIGILAFNALLLARGWIKPSAMRDYGELGGHSHFSRRMKQLRTALTTVSGLDDAIQTEGKMTQIQYRLHPDLLFIDRRTPDTDPVTVVRKTVKGTIPTLADYLPGSLRFNNPADRCSAFSNLLKQYSGDRHVSRALTSLARETDRQMAEFNPEALQMQFELMDRGLVVYLDSCDSPDKITTIANGVAAFHRICTSLKHYFGRMASSFGDTWPGYRDDFYQAAMAENIRLIMSFDGGESLERCSLFYSKAVIAGRGEMISLADSIAANRKGLTLQEHQMSQRINKIEGATYRCYGRHPTQQEIIDQMSVRYSEAQTLEAIHTLAIARAGSRNLYSLDNDKPWAEPPSRAQEADFELQLEQWEMREAISRLFSSDSPLSDIEKIVLSLKFELFSPLIGGAEYITGAPWNSKTAKASGTVFTYPFSKEDFFTLFPREHTDILSHRELDEIIGTKEGTFTAILQRSLSKAHKFYNENGISLDEIVGTSPIT